MNNKDYIQKDKKHSKYLTFLGFLGFLGFNYFKTNNIEDLYFFVNFVWFGNFFLSKINADIADEMYLENMMKAKLFSGNVARFCLVLLMLISIFFPKFSMIPFIAISFGASILSYIFKFYSLER